MRLGLGDLNCTDGYGHTATVSYSGVTASTDCTFDPNSQMFNCLGKLYPGNCSGTPPQPPPASEPPPQVLPPAQQPTQQGKLTPQTLVQPFPDITAVLAPVQPQCSSWDQLNAWINANPAIAAFGLAMVYFFFRSQQKGRR